MAAHLKKKISLDVAADNASNDSLSFAGLVCIQDQHPKFHSGLVNPLPTTDDASQIQKQDTEFDFGSVIAGSAANDPNKNSPADMLFFNGKLLPQSYSFQSNHSQVTSYTSRNTSLMVTQRSNKRSSGNKSDCMYGAAKKPDVKVRNQANKKCTAESRGFGQRIFSSLVSPCRQCPAVEPSKHIMTRSNMKLQ